MGRLWRGALSFQNRQGRGAPSASDAAAHTRFSSARNASALVAAPAAAWAALAALSSVSARFARAVAAHKLAACSAWPAQAGARKERHAQGVLDGAEALHGV